MKKNFLFLFLFAMLLVSCDKKVVVTFDIQGGMGAVNKQELLKGEKAIEPLEDANPIKSGFRFGHWSLEKNGLEFSFDTPIEKDTVLYAVWFEEYIETNEVIFDSNGGSPIDPITVNKGSIISKPENPTKEGYDFLEWRLNGYAYNFSNKVEEDIVLIAEWTKAKNPNEVTVHFDSNGGSSIESITKLKTEKVEKPIDPTRTNYEFVKWQLNGTDYDFNTPLTNTITLKAVWKLVNVVSVEAETMYVNTLILKNESINFSSLVVYATLQDNSVVTLNSNDYEIDSSIDSTVAGNYEVNVIYEGVDDMFIVSVVDPLVAVENNVNLEVDSEAVDTTKFKTIKNALLAIEKSDLDPSTKKIIKIASGIYEEKITVKTPNVIFLGEDKETTIIEYNSASGMKNPYGANWGTDGSAVVTITGAAKGFMAKGVTFKNSFDYFTAGVSDKQALALLNSADQAIYTDVKFLGYQDTLEAKDGRQYYYKVYIEGAIDFIFGNDGPAFFEESIIHGLRDKGYIAVNKGEKGALYGYVFYNNTFTFDESVNDFYLGRPWRDKAKIAYIENKFEQKIIADGWTTMSGGGKTNNPEDENVHFYEYRNMDLNGNVVENKLRSKSITDEQAANYKNKDVVFGKTNGTLTFADDFNYNAQLTELLGLTY